MSRRLIVCDLEATCWDRRDNEQTIESMETIEIGAVKVDEEGGVCEEFSTFIQPVENPRLSHYCQELTHISQNDIDAAPLYPKAVEYFNQWLGDISGHAWVSWGNYDKRQFVSDFNRHGIAPNVMWIPHVNLKRPWRKTTKHKKQGLRAALTFHGYDFIGTPHRGIDDAKNVARLLPHVDRRLLIEEIDRWEGAEISGGPRFNYTQSN